MSDKNKMQSINGSDKWINWIEEIISKNNVKYYEYKDFYNIEKIDEKTYLANWKHPEQYFILKSFNLDNVSVNKEEIIHEFKIHSEINFHKNVINLFGITDKEYQNDQLKEYLLVMEYANGGSLRNYLKENFNNLTWKDKYELAYQLACAVLLLHDKEIAHHDLYPGNIFVHQNTIKLANFGLLSRTKRVSERNSGSFDKVLYRDPKRLNDSNELLQSCSSSKKYDIYSIGVLLWEISSGRPPFKSELYDGNLIKKILQGYKETTLLDTSADYSNLYIECWNNEPDNRPTMNQVVDKLKEIITRTNKMTNYYQPNNYELNSQLLNIETKHEKYANIIQYFNKVDIKEIEPTIQDIHEGIFEEDLSSVIDNLVNIYFAKLNEGNDNYILKKCVFDYFEQYKINLQEVYHWLLNKQNISKFICFLGCFNYHGIGTVINKKKAFELYEKAASLGNDMSLFHLIRMYKVGDGCIENHIIALRLSRKLAKKGYSGGINLLGYCYCTGVGTNIDNRRAFESFQKAADLGNLKSIYNLAVMYYSVAAIKDDSKTFEFSKKSAEKGSSGGIMLLGECYHRGTGVDVDKQMAFKHYQIAADLGNDIAQYNLALMYHQGDGIKENINKAIYWCEKSAEQGLLSAQKKLKELLGK